MKEVEVTSALKCDGCEAVFEIDNEKPDCEEWNIPIGDIRIEMPCGSNHEGLYTGHLCNECMAKVKTFLPNLEWRDG